MFLSSSPIGTPAQNRQYSPLRAILSVSAVVGLFAALVIPPLGLSGEREASAVLSLQPGEMPSQELITRAAEEAEYYSAALKVEELPEPEPEPIEEPQQEQEQQAAAAPPQYTGGGSPEAWMTAAGIDPEDWGYVNFIAERESGWNPNATNASSGACGLIQAHPCSKVPGSGYDPVDNLTWANGYAVGRYGSWEDAYNFWQANHWW